MNNIAAKFFKSAELPVLDPEAFSCALEGIYRRSELEYCGLLFEKAGKQGKIPSGSDSAKIDPRLEAACELAIEQNKHPGLRLGKNRFTPFNLLTEAEKLADDPDIAALFKAIDAANYRSVYCLPFRDLTGAVYVSGVVSRDRQLSQVELRILYSYCLDALEKQQTTASANANNAILTVRERECLTAAARGMTEKQSAQFLSISPFTIRNHIDSCKRKLGARNKLNAIIKGLKLGEIMPSDLETKRTLPATGRR